MDTAAPVPRAASNGRRAPRRRRGSGAWWQSASQRDGRASSSNSNQPTAAKSAPNSQASPPSPSVTKHGAAAAPPVVSEGGNVVIVSDRSPSDAGSGSHSKRKRHRKHSTDRRGSQPQQSQPPPHPHGGRGAGGGRLGSTHSAAAVVGRTGTGSDDSGAVQPIAEQSLTSTVVRPHAQRKPGTVVIKPVVRCIDQQGSLSTKSLKELLRAGVGMPSEADTPCLGPAAAPPCVADTAAGSSNAVGAEGSGGTGGSTAASGGAGTMGERQMTSPMLAFTLDSIATPNTFAVHQAGVPKGGGASVTTRGEDEGMDSLPAMNVESTYQYILRNFDGGSFAFYETAEARATFLEKCYMICDRATHVLGGEPLMQCVYAPVYVFGDVHGNFADLSYFLKSVLPFNDIHLSPCNILCLGDYVDRGPYSLECVITLLALKVEDPAKVTLLRGNHEDRVVCGDRRTYGSDCFLAQCQTVFGVIEGMKLFHAVTAVFRFLPLAAEIVVTNAPNHPHHHAPVSGSPLDDDEAAADVGVEGVSIEPEQRVHLVGSTSKQWKRATDVRHTSHQERILCTHGGIPRFQQPPKEVDSLTFLRNPSFPRLLTLFPNNPMVRDDPEAQLDDIHSDVLQRAWFVMFDLMWSDPAADDNAPSINEWGFGLNARGSNVVSFASKAVDSFLDAFQYSMLFRAHQEKAHGIRLSKSSKVLTIFSSSNYLGHGNGAGCVIVTPNGQVQIVVKTSQ